MNGAVLGAGDEGKRVWDREVWVTGVWYLHLSSQPGVSVELEGEEAWQGNKKGKKENEGNVKERTEDRESKKKKKEREENEVLGKE